jgi:hypothetical protein
MSTFAVYAHLKSLFDSVRSFFAEFFVFIKIAEYVLIVFSVLIEFGMPMKLVQIIKMCLNETCSEVHVGKNMLFAFPVQNGPKQGDAFIAIAFELCFRICHQEGPRKSGRIGINWNIIISWYMLMLLIYWVKT